MAMSEYQNQEGIWLVELRDWHKNHKWNTVEVEVERFASGGLEIIETDGDVRRLRHYRDVRKWIKKLRGGEVEPMQGRKFLVGCWAEESGLHVRIEEDERGLAYIIGEAGPGGEHLWCATIAGFRRERLGRALLPTDTDGDGEGA